MRSPFEEVPKFKEIMQMIYGKNALDTFGQLRIDVLEDMADVPNRIKASKHETKYMIIPTNAKRTLNFYCTKKREK